MAQVSIIIPVLNEARCLKRTLRCLEILDPSPHEIIVVDGGSTDETVAIATRSSVQVVTTDQQGRAVQMNRGAELSRGDSLCFLHGDTVVPDDLIDIITKTLQNPDIACGGFISVMAGLQTTRWGITLHNSIKTHYAPLLFRPHLYFLKGLRILFGDQAMFCRRSDFWACGGFDASLPIMEDADLCERLGQLGRIYQVNRTVQCSDRRVAQLGAFKANLIYLLIGYGWAMGVPATRLKQLYDDIR
ncbi:TIGR04283 family arsenosugar biosynthesis glycosyltransferase [Oscillatoria sp. CS-180]|uniref:TIGR04283 family arsenosugar biosynthesis glycosyltransferase n=1 Tax=Oscillatoria sp. CS-180 TaxID=3021720 RepID=UPI0023307112|nr:TIGR04283 family arsenosugar biosynthesis glycosyltransferase [Oscillatoria sp. CS-180]MDB9529147.1 TIGR04283 family arsenosugar biosynthesis glycosyltransferase [Oscillatoria sp. CS-180]